jgi:hypothetical protein
MGWEDIEALLGVLFCWIKSLTHIVISS